MTVAVVSAIFGDYDVIKTPAPQSIDVKFVMVTDRVRTVPGWNVIAEPVGEGHPRLRAKVPKLHPWNYAPDADAWIWIDGSFQVRSETFVEEAVASSDAAVSMWAHPWRDCLYDEAHASSLLPKYAGVPVLEQAAHYMSQGFPRHAGLWAAGLIVYRERNDDLAGAWWNEMQQWGYQDQISLPVALAATQTPITPLPHGYCQGPWLQWHQHRSEL